MVAQPIDSRYLIGDARELLATLTPASVQMCITSPPYYGLRNYGCDGQLGLEPTPDQYVANLVEVFRGVRRVLKDDGTLWLVLGDSYASGASGGLTGSSLDGGRDHQTERRKAPPLRRPHGVKPKDLIGIPWMVAFALRADGWYLRSDIIWHKPNAMPESVTDRPTRAHEYLFLLSKSARYYYDGAAVREPFADARMGRPGGTQRRERNRGGRTDGYTTPYGIDPSANGGRNKRSVWAIPTKPYAGAHFATFPPALVEPCILAGSRPGDVVLDPFFGSGTVGAVANRLNRRWVGIELNPSYEPLIRERLRAPQQMALHAAVIRPQQHQECDYGRAAD